MELKPPKGTRDISEKESETYNWIISKIRHNFTLFGFEFLQTPHFEKMNVLTSKFSGGEEIMKEIFSFGDQGKRTLGLRYDHTIPLSRFVASRPDLSLPFHRATIGSVFRDGPIKTGRLREFTQADADIYGAKSVNSEIEILTLMSMIYDDIGIDCDIQINNRKLLESIILASKVTQSKVERAMLTLDKLQKIGKDAVIEELKTHGISKVAGHRIFEYIESANTDLDGLYDNIKKDAVLSKEIKDSVLRSIEEIKFILSFDIKGVRFEATLARGLNYYTGTVFEAFIKNNEFKSAISAGGRYRSIFSEGQESVGVSFGIDAMIASGLIELNEKKLSLYIIPVKDNFSNAHEITRILRRENVICGIDVLERAIGKNLKYADSKGYNYALIVGDEEVKSQKYTLRNLQTGLEQKLKIEELIRMFTIQKL